MEAIQEAHFRASVMNWRESINIVLLGALVAICLFEYVFRSQCHAFGAIETELISIQLQWMLLPFFFIWCGTALVLAFRFADLFLTVLIVIVAVLSIVNYSAISSALNAAVLVVGVTLGKGIQVLLQSKIKKMSCGKIQGFRFFLICLTILLAFAALWHLDMVDNYYHGPRWMGLWNNPNLYGMLMGAGSTLAIGLLASNAKYKIRNVKLGWVLGLAAGMMGVGLVMSYSRGSWLGTTVGLLYLAWSYGRFKWRYVLPVAAIAAAMIFCFWNATPDSAPWYVKRADLGRPSAQHRVAAWKAALHIMWDHPFGVGWNNAVSVYAKGYSPPEGGAAAIATNDYLMLGTQLGWPGLICFVTYVGLCLRGGRMKHLTPALSPSVPYSLHRRGEGEPSAATLNTASLVTSHSSLQTACRAGALSLLVAFWFDGGLFTLATAAVFWILLELGSERAKLKTEMLKTENQKAGTDLSLVPPSPGCGATSTSAATKLK